MGICCCTNRNVEKKYYAQKWRKSLSTQEKSNIILNLFRDNILKLPSQDNIIKIDRVNRIIHHRDKTYRILFTDNIYDIKNVNTNEILIVITDLSYHQILKIKCNNIIIYDYYQIEQILQS